MAFPSKTNYLSGDILTAAQMNDIGSEINALNGTAGKNKIINGDFRINQRGFTSTTSNSAYGFDRWTSQCVDGTNTMSAQTFTVGSAPVAGYEAINFVRMTSSGQTAAGALTSIGQFIEDVRTFAGQTVTVSFWAKASTGTPNVTVFMGQIFGSGGSIAVQFGAIGGKQQITTSWARYSFVLNVPSISGKTIGTNNALLVYLTQSAGTNRNGYTDSLGIQSATIDYWGVQVEAGNLATSFQTATGTLQGELAACQRYYQRLNSVTAYGGIGGIARVTSTGAAGVAAWFPAIVPMRVAPTALDSGGAWQLYGTGAFSMSSIILNSENPTTLGLYATASSATVNTIQTVIANNNAASYLGWSAEL